ncbi:hypothetical protein [Bartonella gabonensis]|uniref:hypothetical protein n=1 Tax=Bartonella gabonensis TaxID=2699889 RepID=UPI0015890491|nr:hypothetical protein [Bartonella gabonensis]
MEAVFILGGATRYGVLDGQSLYGSWGWRYSDVVFENSDITLHGCETRRLYVKESSSQEEYIEAEALAALGEIQFKKTNSNIPNDTAIYIEYAERLSYITALEGAPFFAGLFLDVKVNAHGGVEADAPFLYGELCIDRNFYAEADACWRAFKQDARCCGRGT